ncbi:MAG: Mannonate dehydratase [Chloroflexi bacterium ADurb.Bin325]|nr:MAG: Mannonate dehydratase [Chloroflexi bacterium ADurb.Bin325]
MSAANPYPLIIPGYAASRPGIQIGTQLPADASADDMQFARQLGVEWVMTSVPAAEASVETYRAVVRRFAEGGLKVYRLANHAVHNMEAVTLNLPERDAKIAEYLAYIRMLGAAGIRYATYAHMANGIWSTEPEPVRGGASGRAFRLERARTGWWIDRSWDLPLTHGREYTEDELWENYAYFIRQVAPVAEEAGVYIGIHPDDPPVYPLGGIPRCIFGNFEGYRRALELADSPNIGVCLCLGCWLEGGPAMGKSAVEAIRYFGGQRKLFKVHFRNVTAPMPEGFVETFLDDGYGDMLEIMAALQEVGFDGAIISDHLQQVVGGRYAAEAYAVGYMRGLIQAVAARAR